MARVVGIPLVVILLVVLALYLLAVVPAAKNALEQNPVNFSTGDVPDAEEPEDIWDEEFVAEGVLPSGVHVQVAVYSRFTENCTFEFGFEFQGQPETFCGDDMTEHEVTLEILRRIGEIIRRSGISN